MIMISFLKHKDALESRKHKEANKHHITQLDSYSYTGIQI